MSDLKLDKKPNYEYTYKMLDDGTRIAIVIDKSVKFGRSVTNSVRTIARDLNVKHLIYLASDSEWWYWSRQKDYCPLVYQDSKTGDLTPAPTFDIAWDILKAKYLNVAH